MTVKQFTDVKKSPLYKAIAPSLSPKDRKEFARMLTLARDNYPAETELDFALDETRLGWAFVWDQTPQGYYYWSELHKALEAAGHPSGNWQLT